MGHTLPIPVPTAPTCRSCGSDSRCGRHPGLLRATASPSPPRCGPSATRSTVVRSRPAGEARRLLPPSSRRAARQCPQTAPPSPTHEDGDVNPFTLTGTWQCLEHPECVIANMGVWAYNTAILWQNLLAQRRVSKPRKERPAVYFPRILCLLCWWVHTTHPA